ncbi:M16 family metallopeptidase [Brochothrix thermosphacta]|uniref:M16 family metallopeptidase n=1 Tax=Brochothrix thermosphacta TaxID=2756 RepID=UPI00265D1610|nr:insulinase family protein [Brochothrix thermosphacta]WKK70133.1 insulinase family protein [Brochothrix thermosphacta]
MINIKNNETIQTINGYPVMLEATTQFQQVEVSWHFKALIERDTITKRSLFANWFGLSEDYPTLNAFQQRLSYLFGASLDAIVEKSGDYHIVHCTLIYPNPKLIDDLNYEDDVWSFLQSTLFKPIFTPTSALEELFAREQETLIKRFDSIQEDPTDIAMEDVLQKLYQNDVYRYHAIGVKEDVTTINLQALQETYQKMMVEDEQLITITGDVEWNNIKKQLDQFPTGNVKKIQRYSFRKSELADLGKTVKHHDVMQAKTIITYQLPLITSQQERVVLQLAYYIWAVDSHSRLFEEVREQAQLAYEIYGSMNITKQLAYAIAGVESKQTEKALELMKRQQQAMAEQGVTQEEIDLAKKTLWHDLQLELDEIEGVNDIAFSRQLLPHTLSLSEWQQMIAEITPKMIQKMMQQWEYKGSYCLLKKERSIESTN